MLPLQRHQARNRVVCQVPSDFNALNDGSNGVPVDLHQHDRICSRVLVGIEIEYHLPFYRQVKTVSSSGSKNTYKYAYRIV